MIITEEYERTKARPYTKNKIVLKLVVYLMMLDYSTKEIGEYLGISESGMERISHIALDKYTEYKGVFSGSPYDINAEHYKWDDITEDDLMKLPLPHEWRLPIYL